MDTFYIRNEDDVRMGVSEILVTVSFNIRVATVLRGRYEDPVNIIDGIDVQSAVKTALGNTGIRQVTLRDWEFI